MSEAIGFPDFQRRKDRSVLQILNRVILFLVVLLVLIAMLAGFYPALRARSRERAELTKVRLQVVEAQQLFDKNARQVSRLKNDPEYLGIVARDKLELMKPGETIFRFDPILFPPSSPQNVPKTPSYQ